MGRIKIGCETYTWQMPGETYKGKMDHIMEVASKAGFAGIEPETSFLGNLFDPMKMNEALTEHQLELAVLCQVEDWRHTEETAEERERTDYWIEYLAYFPDTVFLLVQMPGEDRNYLHERQQNLISCINAIAQRASNEGITCSYHPNSPEGSIIRTYEDYQVLLNGINASSIGYTPDVGHIAKGGMDPLQIMKEFRSLINLVHYKDMNANGTWAQTGQGVIDFAGITNYLHETDYEGWIIMEDEADAAITDPDGVTLKDGEFVKNVLNPLIV